MRLANFIDQHTAAILDDWESFAATLLPAADGMTVQALRDHALEILRTIAMDLRTPQSDDQKLAKSRGGAPVVQGAPETAADLTRWGVHKRASTSGRWWPNTVR